VRVFIEILQGIVGLVEKLVLEAAELAETLDGGRFKGDDDGA